MPEQINASADLWVAVEADIPGADTDKDATTSGKRSAQPNLAVGTHNTSLPTLANGTSGSLQLDASGRLLIADGGGSITIDGTVTANTGLTQSLTDTQLRATAVPVSGTFFQTTQPVSASSLPLPSGAATAANQSTLIGLLPAALGAQSAAGSLSVVPGTSTTFRVDNGGTFAVQAAQSGTWTVTGSGGSFPVTDSGGSLTIDAPVGTPAFVRLSDGTSPITTLPVSLASLPTLATGSNVIGAVTQSGNWTARLADGAGNALTSAARGAERALSVQIVDASGTQVTSFSGGGGSAGGYQPSVTITRAANTTPYTANDVIGGALTIANAGSTAGHVILNSVRTIFNIAAVPSGMSTMFLFLYDVTPPSAVADNGAFTVPSGDRASLLTPDGIALGTPVLSRGGSSVVLQANNLNLQFKLAAASTSLFGYLVTSAAFTPAANSETYTMTLQLLGV